MPSLLIRPWPLTASLSLKRRPFVTVLQAHGRQLRPVVGGILQRRGVPLPCPPALPCPAQPDSAALTCPASLHELTLLGLILQAMNGTSVKSPFSKSLDRLKVMVNCVYEESAREQGTCNSSLPVTSKLEIVRRMEAQREELGLSAARYVDSYLRWHLRCLKTVDMPKPDKPDGLIRYLKEGAQRKAAKETACAAVGLAGMSEAD